MSILKNNDPEYREWIQELSKRFRQSQIKAAVKVNTELVRFYWSLGEDIVNRQSAISSTQERSICFTVNDLKKCNKLLHNLIPQ